jgi:glutathione S-transferase
MFFEQYSHEPNIAVLRFWALHPDAAAPSNAEVATKRAGGTAALEALERHLGAHEFLVANAYTIADIALYAYTHVSEEAGFDLSAYPHVREWLARVAAQPRHISIGA